MFFWFFVIIFSPLTLTKVRYQIARVATQVIKRMQLRGEGGATALERSVKIVTGGSTRFRGANHHNYLLKLNTNENNIATHQT